MTTDSARSSDQSADRGAPATLWWAPLDVPASSLASLSECLSSLEQARADEYHDPLARDHFVAARGWLRHLVAGQTDCRPDEVRFSIRPGGKPEIECSDLKFNGARSAGIALYATSWSTEVGVDVETIRDGAESDIDDIASKFFSVHEQQALAALTPDERLAASFQCWTCKEAYVKGIGSGLSFPVRTVDTWAEDGRAASVSNWTVLQIELAPGFAAAVAGEGPTGWIPAAPTSVALADSDPSTAIIRSLSGALGGTVERFSGGSRWEPTW